MTPSNTATDPGRATGAPKPPPLPHPERAEIQRQGAKAAARGEPAEANPLHAPRNRPSATGETAERWHQRSTAWEQGHAAQTAVRHLRHGASAQRPAAEPTGAASRTRRGARVDPPGA